MPSENFDFFNSDEEDSSGPSGSTTAQGISTSVEQVDEIGKRETTMVIWSRFLVFVVLLVISVSVSASVYIRLGRAELEAFEKQAQEDIDKVFSQVGAALETTLGSTDSFMVSMSSFMQATNSSWPTVPDFAVKAAKLRTLSKAFVVSTYPLVTQETRAEWEPYSDSNNDWVNNGLQVQLNDPNFHGVTNFDWSGWGTIHTNMGGQPENATGPFLPTWQSSPVVAQWSPYNWDLHASFPQEADIVLNQREVLIGTSLNVPTADEGTVVWAEGYLGSEEDPTEPLAAIYYPIVDQVSSEYVNQAEEDRKAVGIIAISLYWRTLIRDILPEGSRGILVTIGNECNQSFSYEINGPHVQYVQAGSSLLDSYSSVYKKSMLKDIKADTSTYSAFPLNSDFCPYWIEAYPTVTMRNDFVTKSPLQATLTIVAIFTFTSLVFGLYVYMNERRQKKVLRSALKTSAIVSSLFPSMVRERLFNEKDEPDEEESSPFSGLRRLTSSISQSSVETDIDPSRPIAELFPETTVYVAGFTAWSSVRNPSQVFYLLEEIYSEFDAIAKRRRVFKVETIGDCYVAVAGLPNPDPSHALTMARFASDCLTKFHRILGKLEERLGPGTADLKLRIGLNSGPCTAGVLRGERSRFQLFGDTVNTASRMESTGIPGKIQVSEATANALQASGKGHWVMKREEMITAKGKGSIQTYFVDTSSTVSCAGSVSADESSMMENDQNWIFDDKTSRLVKWNVDLLIQSLNAIVAHREAEEDVLGKRACSARRDSFQGEGGDKIVIDECKEVIEFAPFNEKIAKKRKGTPSVPISQKIKDEVYSLVSSIARMYSDANAFHGFEHASHVTMSVVKLLKRIMRGDVQHTLKQKHMQTYGLTSDPMIEFACVFAALVHDVDHPGVSNSQLVKEGSKMASVYRGQSVAEQNSVDIAWMLFAQDEYRGLRQLICNTKAELAHFRQLFVNIVMATDIMDKELKGYREDRWKKAFGEDNTDAEMSQQDLNRKATIVIEHLIQASDVSHTMQHWHIFLKWNMLLFEEMYTAYSKGRADKDPSEGWYEGELDFFDGYIIPLAKKLRDCGVFGVSCDEYLSYAENNRKEWEAKGRTAIAARLKDIKQRMQERS